VKASASASALPATTMSDAKFFSTTKKGAPPVEMAQRDRGRFARH
jgi:hypothetical protein